MVLDKKCFSDISYMINNLGKSFSFSSEYFVFRIRPRSSRGTSKHVLFRTCGFDSMQYTRHSMPRILLTNCMSQTIKDSLIAFIIQSFWADIYVDFVEKWSIDTLCC